MTGASGSSILYYYNNNQSFGGATLTPATGGHTIGITVNKNSGGVVRCDVYMYRQGGIYFNMPYLSSTGANSQVIATLPSGYRPTTDITTIGYSASDNTWASNALSWGGFQVATGGQIYQRGNGTATITTLQTGLEVINGSLFFMTNGSSSFTGDGIA